MADIFEVLYNDLDLKQQMLTAVSCSMIDSVKRLLDGNKIDVNSKLLEQNGNTALHVASQKGNKNCLQYLLGRGANPDTTNHFGLTPLAMALRYGHCDCAQILLQTGSDPSLIWKQWNELYVWMDYSHDVIQLLLTATPYLHINGERTVRVLYETFLRTVKSSDLIKIFFLSGNKLTADEMSHLLIQVQQFSNPSLYQWLTESCRAVPSLQHVCRLATRRNLYPNVLFASRRLPLPVQLQDYVIFSEVTRPDTQFW